jgi:hypothetical protein
MAKILTDQIHLDTVKSIYGTGSDLQIYHDGSNSYIDDTGTGSLVLKTGALLVRNPSDASMLDAQSGGAINLYHNGSKKFETTSAGATVTGALSITGDGSNAATLTESSIGIFTIAAVDDIILDAGGDIAFDAGGLDLRLKANGNTYGYFNGGSDNFYIGAGTQDKDIIFIGNDGGSQISMLTLDASDAGAAEFNSRVYVPDYIAHVGDSDTLFGFSGADTYIVNTGGTTALTIDSSQDATFAGKINVAGSSNNQSVLNVKTDSGSIGSIGFETGSEITGIISSATDVMDFRVGDGVGMSSARNLRIDTDGLRITGTTSISSIANASGDPDKFLCVNGSGVVQYRTGAQVRSDIGAGTSSTTGTVTNVTASTASGLDGLSVSSGTTTPVVGLDITGMGAYADGFTDGSIDYSQVFVPLCDDDNGGGNKKTNIRDLLAVNDKSLVVLNANFSDDSSTTSYLYVPYNTTSETTSAQYYVHWAAPHTGRFKRVVMQHVYGSMSSSFTTQLKITKNGLSTTTSSELTPSNGTSDGSYIEFNPSGNNVSFVKGDRFTIAYQKSASSKYWRGVAFSVIIELDKI